MGLIKCPRCDLNYIKDTEKLCPVCLRELKGIYTEEEEDIELCSVCNAAPVVPGKDMCLNCLKEMNGTLCEDNETENEPERGDRDEMDLDAVDPMNEEILPDDDDMKDEDMKKLDEEMSLEQAIEEENEDDEDDDEDKENGYRS